MFLLRLLLDGLAEGGIITLVAIAITLIFGISKFVNAALGDLLTLAAYLALFLNISLGLALWAALLVSALATALIGILCYFVVFKPLGPAPVTLFIASIGLALALRAIIQMIWGGDILAFPGTATGQVMLGGIGIPYVDLIVLSVCALAVGCFFLLLNKTRIGREVRATASNMDLARTSGIDTRQVTVIVWFAAVALLSVAGVLLGVSTAIQPEMGWNLLLPAFAAAILGGLGNTTGAAIGGFTIGIAMQFSVVFASAGYKHAIAFAIMIIMLLFRPGGLIPSKARQ